MENVLCLKVFGSLSPGTKLYYVKLYAMVNLFDGPHQLCYYTIRAIIEKKSKEAI